MQAIPAPHGARRHRTPSGESKRVTCAQAEQEVATRFRLDEPAVTGIDDHSADVVAIEKVVDACKFVESPAADILLEPKMIIDHDVAIGKVRVFVVDIDAIALLRA